MKRRSTVRSAVRKALCVGAISAASGVGSLALAQSNDATSDASDAFLEEITVTGSRIQRQDYESSSPVVSLSSDVFRRTGTINAEELINTLPQVVPSFSSGNNNPGNGQSWINLRGLGSQRNLVLIDGKRPMPGNPEAVVDINTIPVAMIERVEVISGGASAVYGSEAIAGATNFILKKGFNGVDLNAQYGVSAEGDTEGNSIELVVGSDFAAERGNATLWATYNDRERLGKGERPFSAQAVSGTSFYPSGHIQQTAGNPWSLAVVQDVFTNQYGAAAPASLGELVGNDDGTLFTRGDDGEGIINFRTVLGEDIDGLFVAQNFRNGVVEDDEYSYNFEPWNNLVLPQERFNLGSSFIYDVGGGAELYSRLMYTNYSSSSQLAPSPAPTGANTTNPLAGAQFTVPVTNPFVVANAGLSQILASRTGDNIGLPGAGADEDFIYRRRFVENGPRVERYERDVHQIVLGLRGDLSDTWRFDFWGSTGKYNEQLNQDGNISVSRVESLLDAPDGGVSICAGGFNPVGALTLSDECADYVGVVAKNNTTIIQNQLELVANGTIFELPAGDVSLALGAYFQDMDFTFTADEILASGDVAGFSAEDDIIGRVRNTDIFLEAYVPLLNGLPLVQDLGATFGYRLTDHNRAGNFDSFKAELDWSVNDAVRVRTSFQRAVRAPNVDELFAPLAEDSPQVDDPCNFDSSFRTGPDAARVEALCVAQGIDPGTVATYSQGNDQIDALLGGNPNLTEETADTLTLGFVWEPAFSEELQVSVDYFDIEIEDVISFIDPSTVVNRCFNAGGFNPDFSADNEWCTRFGRFITTGEIQDLLEVQENIGGLRTDGIDVQIDWATDVGRAGTLGFNFVSTYVNEYAIQTQSDAPWQDFVGTIGQDVGEFYPDFKATFTTIWDIGNFSSTARLRYIPALDSEQVVIQGTSDPDECNCTGTDAITYLDFSSRWQATNDLSVQLGIDNVLDDEPELFTPDQDSGTNPSVYDVIGRRYYLALNYSF